MASTRQRKLRMVSVITAIALASLAAIPPSSAAAASRLWPTTTKPQVTAETADRQRVELGLRFRVATDGNLDGVSFYKGTTNTGRHTVSLWTASGERLATARSKHETVSGWQTVKFAKSVSVKANTTYIASYLAPRGNYAIDENALTSPLTSNGITALANGGVYKYGGGFPNETWRASNYWVDVLYRSGSVPTTSTSTPTTPSTTSTTNPTTTTSTTVPPATTTTTTKPTTTTTTPPPSTGDWPGPQSTGVTGCGTLTKVNNGDEVILDQDNTVYQNVELTNPAVFQVRAHNITIRCVKMNGTGWFGIDNQALTPANGFKDLTVQNVEIDCQNSPQVIGLLVQSATVRNVNVHNCDHMLNAGGDNVDIADSYCHDLTVNDSVHADCIQSLGGLTNLVIRHNSFYGWDTSDVLLGQEFGDAHNVVIDNNRFMSSTTSNPPAYLLYLSGTNTIVTNNRFTHHYTYGPCTLNTDAANITWSGNVWDEDGTPLGLDRC